MNSIREAITNANVLYQSLQENASPSKLSSWVTPPRGAIRQEFSAAFGVPSGSSGGGIFPYTVLTRTTFPPCKLALAALEKINISELKPEKRHHGRYLLLKVLEIASSEPVVNALVEDDLGDVAHLCIICIEPEVFESCSSFVLKEPFYELSTISRFRLRCDHSCEIICLGNEPFFKSDPQKLVAPVFMNPV
jgi:hypothetical protein